jgi:hypothetical protein
MSMMWLEKRRTTKNIVGAKGFTNICKIIKSSALKHRRIASK